jgi:hypothetical protein
MRHCNLDMIGEKVKERAALLELVNERKKLL